MKYLDAWKNKKLQSNKFDHYFEIYDQVFNKFYRKKISLLEIGVGHGGSMEVLQKLFKKNSVISGLDVQEKSKIVEKKIKNIKIFIGSQTDDNLLNKICDHHGNFDIIIDDGSHQPADIILTFLKLFPRLLEGGIYLIENTHVCYSSSHLKTFFGLGLYDYFKSLTEKMNIEFMSYDPSNYSYDVPRELRDKKSKLVQENINFKPENHICKNIFSIEFFHSMIVVRKKNHKEPYIVR